MKRFLWIVIPVLVLAVGFTAFRGWHKHSDERAEALSGLEVLRQLITKDNYQNYGLKSFDEVAKLQLGEGTDVFFVLNNDLKEFGPQSKITSVVKPSQSRIYPVLVDGEGRLLITLRKRHGSWHVASFGESDVAYNLAKLQNGRAWLNLPKDGVIAIQIPATHLSFASFGHPSQNEDLLLTPLNATDVVIQGFGRGHTDFFRKNSQFTAEVHGTVGAKEVFQALADTARVNDDSAP